MVAPPFVGRAGTMDEIETLKIALAELEIKIDALANQVAKIEIRLNIVGSQASLRYSKVKKDDGPTIH